MAQRDHTALTIVFDLCSLMMSSRLQGFFASSYHHNVCSFSDIRVCVLDVVAEPHTLPVTYCVVFTGVRHDDGSGHFLQLALGGHII